MALGHGMVIVIIGPNDLRVLARAEKKLGQTGQVSHEGKNRSR